ncbi:MAG: O-antigen ligase family protein [Candidatus Acidiferrales bacterium]
MIFFYFLMFASPFYHHPFFDRGFGTFTVVKGIGAVCAIFALFYLFSKGRSPNYLGTTRAKVFLVLCAWGLISWAKAGAMRDWAADPAFSYFSFLILFFVTLTIVDTPKKIWWSLLSALAGVAFGALYMIREFQKYHSMYADLRPSAVVGDPNYYTLAALLVLPVAYYWVRGVTEKFYRLAILGMLFLVSVAVALAASRGGLLGLMVGTAFLVWQSRNRVRNSAILFMLIALPMLLVPRSPLKRLLHPDYADTEGTATREKAWRAGLKMVETKPLTGIGLGLYKPLLGEYSGDPNFHQIAHNSYLEIAAEQGIPALLLFLWVLWETFRALSRTRKITVRSKDHFLFPMAAGLQCGILGCMVGDLFLSAEYLKLFWIVVFLSIPLERFARQRARVKETPIVVEEAVVVDVA